MSRKESKSQKRVPPEAKIIGANLRGLRLEMGFSREDMGVILEVSFQQIQKYEIGQNRFPIDKLYRLRHFFDVPYERFFEGIDPIAGGSIPKPNRDPVASAVYIKVAGIKSRSLKDKIQQVVTILAA